MREMCLALEAREQSDENCHAGDEKQQIDYTKMRLPQSHRLASRKCYHQREIGPFLLRNKKQPVDLFAIDNDKLPVPVRINRAANAIGE